jgi:hypothetical protein
LCLKLNKGTGVANPTSFFGTQKGEFSLGIKCIKAVTQAEDLEGGVVGEKNVRQMPGSCL